jgi:hypothetical protein
MHAKIDGKPTTRRVEKIVIQYTPVIRNSQVTLENSFIVNNFFCPSQMSSLAIRKLGYKKTCVRKEKSMH